MRNLWNLSVHRRACFVLTLLTILIYSDQFIVRSKSLEPYQPSVRSLQPSSPYVPAQPANESSGIRPASMATGMSAVPAGGVCNTSDTACLWEEDSSPIGCRIPLIFVHGIHGNQITQDDPSCYNEAIAKGLIKKGQKIDNPRLAPNKCYFNSLISKMSGSAKPALTTNFKIYRFHYKSDVNNVQIIALELGKLLDKLITADPNVDKEFMIVAHSMGGLVSRAYMNLYRHNSGNSGSRFKGKMAGDRVLKLITLGTPHHGTQLQSGDARTKDIPNGGSWSNAISLIEWFIDAPCLTCPNRSDLRWDSYDGGWNTRAAYRNNPNEHNSLLSALAATTYDAKIYPYYGVLGDAKIPGRNADLVSFGKMGATRMAYTLNNNKHIPNQHRGLIALGVMLERIELPNFDDQYPINYLFNDGMVRFDSASFSQRSQRGNVRSCPGYDHGDMKDSASYNCKAGAVQKPLAQLVVDDLSLAEAPGCPRIVVSTSLTIDPGKGPYSVGQNLGGTFTITNRGNTELDARQILIAGRVGNTCPNKVCPDFTIRPNVKLAPGQTFSYSGNFAPSLPGSYTFSVAYQTQDNNWVIPVDSERGTINKLELDVQYPPPTLTRSVPGSVSVSQNPQTVFLYGTGLSRILYCQVKAPDGKVIYIYIPLSQVKGRSDTQLETRIKFLTRGNYYITAFTMDKGSSNPLSISVN